MGMLMHHTMMRQQEEQKKRKKTEKPAEPAAVENEGEYAAVTERKTGTGRKATK